MSQTTTRRRRQLGADRRSEPLPAVPEAASSRALAMGRLALAVTGGAWLAYVLIVAFPQFLPGPSFSWRGMVEALAYLFMVTLLTLSAVAYLITRLGYLRRTRSHARTPRAEIEAFFAGGSPTATVIIPSYRELPEVNRQTMLSAALQEFPELRVVLLIDDPPTPDRTDRQVQLEATRRVPVEIAELLEGPRKRFAESMTRAEARVRMGTMPTADDLRDLIADYDHAVAWLEDQASSWVVTDHTDEFFVEHVLGALARDLAVVATAIGGALLHRSTMSGERVVQLQRRLVSIFTADLTSFERKQYLTLSSEPNKAMNLNSYIGLMGGSYWVQTTSAGCLLLPCSADDPDATLHVPKSDYVLTLDADSMLLPEYCLRLVHLMEQPENRQVGVAQTPYSAFPGAPTRVERLAGATTDIQYIVHQGLADHGAAFWVGANAVLRTRALEELRIDDASDGHPISRFISDRTVIEDTESTLDLTAKGWTIVNYPERLAYSASPPDFGALCVQRQRWANGGLLIMRKLRTHWRAQKERGERRNPIELLLRLNYLASITWATAGLILLLAYPYSDRLMSVLVILMSTPYFLAMASDLRRCGYKRTDVFRIYGFNMIMLPVNASGVLRSIGQMVTGHKVAFARTPKVRHRSVAPAAFVIFPYLIVILSALALRTDVLHQHWAHAVFAAANVVIIVPAIVAVIGVRYSIIDVWLGFTDLLYVPVRASQPKPKLDPVVDWAAVLYHGSVDRPSGPHRALAPARTPEAAIATPTPTLVSVAGNERGNVA